MILTMKEMKRKKQLLHALHVLHCKKASMAKFHKRHPPFNMLIAMKSNVHEPRANGSEPHAVPGGSPC
jgi:hypothetical protein